MKKLVLFDLDGTLADTSDGIYKSYQYAAEQMGFGKIPEKLLEGVIGDTLLKVFQTRFGYEELDANRAVDFYRERYELKGVYEVTAYENIKELLELLRNNGYMLAVATLKYEVVAKQQLEHLGLKQYFDVISGADKGCQLTKADIINKAIIELIDQKEPALIGKESEKIEELKSQAVMIGDSPFDAIGAKESGVDFIGVTYGLNFHSKKEVEPYHPIFIAESVKDMIDYFIS